MSNPADVDGDGCGDGSRLLFCSSQEVGWTSLVVRRVADAPAVEDLEIAPIDAQRFVLPTAGVRSAESYIDGRWRQQPLLRPGRIGGGPPGRSTRLRWRSTTEQLESLHVYLPGAALRRTALQVWDDDHLPVRADCSMLSDPVLTHVVLGLAAAAESGAPDLYAESAREFLAVHVLLRHGGRPTPSDPVREDVRIARATEYMRENLHLPLTLADIAREAGLSSYHFLRVFKTATGRTPVRHLVDLRIASARRHLERSRIPVSEIAYLCGFASGAHFSTAFSRRVGMSPSAYRNAYRQ